MSKSRMCTCERQAGGVLSKAAVRARVTLTATTALTLSLQECPRMQALRARIAAKEQAARAKKGLKRGTPQWVKANDILQLRAQKKN